jgi:membrane protein DedA with SNARE-associated domain
LEQSVLALVAAHGLPVVALMVFLAELGIPTGMSPKVALLIAGSVAVDSRPELVGSLALVAVANLLGTVALHTIARTGGVRLIDRLHRRRKDPHDCALSRWRRRLGGYDAAAVFVGRILPIVRIYVTVAAGLMRMRWRNFVLGAAPAGLVWSGTPLFFGYCFRTSVHDFAAGGSTVSRVFFLAVPLFGVVLAAVYFIRRRWLAPSSRSNARVSAS